MRFMQKWPQCPAAVLASNSANTSTKSLSDIQQYQLHSPPSRSHLLRNKLPCVKSTFATDRSPRSIRMPAREYRFTLDRAAKEVRPGCTGDDRTRFSRCQCRNRRNFRCNRSSSAEASLAPGSGAHYPIVCPRFRQSVSPCRKLPRQTAAPSYFDA